MELDSEVLSASIASEIIDLIIDRAITNGNEEINPGPELVDEFEEETREDLNNDTIILPTEVIMLPEKKSDEGTFGNEAITAEKAEFKANEFVVQKMIDDQKSDGDIHDKHTAIENSKFASSSEAMTDDDGAITSGNEEINPGPELVDEFEEETREDLNNDTIILPTEVIMLPEKKSDEGTFGNEAITAEKAEFKANEFVGQEIIDDQKSDGDIHDKHTAIENSELASSSEAMTDNDGAITSGNEEINPGTELVDEFEENTREDLNNDTIIPPTEVIMLPEKKSDKGTFGNEAITAEKAEFKANEFVVQKMIDDQKSDGDIHDKHTAIENSELASSSEAMTDDDGAITSGNEEINPGPELVDEFEEDTREDLNNDTIIPPTEVIMLPEKKSDEVTFGNEAITAEKAEFKANEFVVQEIIDDQKSDGDIHDKHTAIENSELASSSEAMTDNDGAITSGNEEINPGPELVDEFEENTREDLNNDTIIPPTEVIMLPEKKSDEGTFGNEAITAEKAEFKANEFVVQEIIDDQKSDGDIHDKHTAIENSELASSSEAMTDDDDENKISSEEEIQFTEQFDVENDNEKAISGDGDCEGLKVDKQEVSDGTNAFHKTETVMELAFGETNTAANCLSDSGVTTANTIAEDLQVEAAANQGDFFDNELLRKKGYTLSIFGSNRLLTNSLFSSTNDFDNCIVKCLNLPHKMLENHLTPLFEKVGKVFKLKIVLPNENRNVKAFVTYTTEEDANKAIQTLHKSKMQGNLIRCVKYVPNVRIYVANIPHWITELELLNKFIHLTTGLKKLIFIEAHPHAITNRGFCFLDYLDNRKARNAKRFILASQIFGRQLTCEWAHQKPVKKYEEKSKPSSTLHISNLESNIRSSDLRKLFSVYGTVTDVDKDGTFATLVFNNSKDAQRAALGFDKKMLGDNVKISQNFQQKPK